MSDEKFARVTRFIRRKARKNNLGRPKGATMGGNGRYSSNCGNCRNQAMTRLAQRQLLAAEIAVFNADKEADAADQLIADAQRERIIADINRARAEIARIAREVGEWGDNLALRVA
jgi:hypothetical protein